MKLNVTHRVQIVDKAISSAFDKRAKAHDVERKKFADQLWTHEHGAAEKIAAKMPDGWVKKTISYYLDHPDFETGRHRASKTAAAGSFSMSKNRFCPCDYGITIKLRPGHPFYDRAHDLAVEEIAIASERETLRVKLLSLVNSCTTIKQLTETWPAGVKFFPPIEAATGRGLIPVNLINEINNSLGLRV